MSEQIAIGNAGNLPSSHRIHAMDECPDAENSMQMAGAATHLWDFCNDRHLFESSHALALIFCFDVTRRH